MNLLDSVAGLGVATVAVYSMLTAGDYAMQTAENTPTSSIALAIKSGHCKMDLCKPMREEYAQKELDKQSAADLSLAGQVAAQEQREKALRLNPSRSM